MIRSTHSDVTGTVEECGKDDSPKGSGSCKLISGDTFERCVTVIDLMESYLKNLHEDASHCMDS